MLSSNTAKHVKKEQRQVKFCKLKGGNRIVKKARETRPGESQKHKTGHWDSTIEIMLSVL